MVKSVGVLRFTVGAGLLAMAPSQPNLSQIHPIQTVGASLLAMDVNDYATNLIHLAGFKFSRAASLLQ